MSTAPPVFVIDDDTAFRDAVCRSLRFGGFAVAPFASAEAFLRAGCPARRGCLVTDVRMPGMDGLALQALLAQRRIELPVIFVTGHGDVAMAVAALKRGAVDFLEKPFPPAALLQSVERALARLQRQEALEAERALVEERLRDLTPREREVLEGLVAGEPAKRIAARLRLSPRTVEHHRENLMAKLGARSLHELLVMAFVAGLREPRLPG